MQCDINGRLYNYIPNTIQSKEHRDNYFKLAKKIFGLDFYPWYKSGFCGYSFIPYSLYDGDIAIASVGVSISEMKWKNELKHCTQISTVMTEPEYRGKGLSRWLMELVLKEWEEKSDFIYLYANDSVVDFYPKFGFEKTTEYRYSMPISQKIVTFRKLDVTISDDVHLIAEKYRLSNPFSSLTMENNLNLLMFHCITFLHDNILELSRKVQSVNTLKLKPVRRRIEVPTDEI